MQDWSGATWKATQGYHTEDEHDGNTHFSASPIHYSGSHWAVTYQKQQEIDNRRWQVSNARVSLFSFASTIYIAVCNFTDSLKPVCGAINGPEVGNHRHKNLRWSSRTGAQKLLSSRLMVRLIIHTIHLWVTRNNMGNDEYSGSSAGTKRQTKIEKGNPQIGTAVWRGTVENASLGFIQILCRPLQPDPQRFRIKPWTWQVMTIYSTKMLNKGLLDHSLWAKHFNKAILAPVSL